MRELFLEKAIPCFRAHLWALRNNREEYVAALKELETTGVIASVSGSVKAKVLAALHTCSMHHAVDGFLPNCEVADISKALILLDRP